MRENKKNHLDWNGGRETAETQLRLTLNTELNNKKTI